MKLIYNIDNKQQYKLKLQLIKHKQTVYILDFKVETFVLLTYVFFKQ